MAEKLITSRVKQRFDTLTEWQKVWETFAPLKGEVCKIQIPANTAVTGLRTSSSVRVMTKTGDGETPLKDLPWDSAIGADETQLSKGADATASATLTHGGTFTAVTDTTVNGHKITDKTTTYTLPAETSLFVNEATSETELSASFGGSVNVVTGVAKGTGSHKLNVTKQPLKLPNETAVSVDTLTGGTSTLTHGGTFTALTAAAKGGSSHNIDVTPTKFTLPAETVVNVIENNFDDVNNMRPALGVTKTLRQEEVFTYVDSVDKGSSSHDIRVNYASVQLPAETTLTRGNDSNTTETLTHGGTFTAVTDTTVNGHQISDVTKTFTLPTETAVTVDQGNATTATLSHGGTITLISGVTKGDTSHNIDVAKTTIKLPSETTLEKGTDATGTATTLTHGGKFKAVTDTSVSGHKITDTVTEFTLPAETTLSKVENAPEDTATLSHGGTFKAMVATDVAGHSISDMLTEFTLPSETSVTVDTLSANTKTLTHGETFTVLTAAAKGGSSHNIDVTPTKFTLPAMPTGAMIFKGTLGTGGTVTTLPTSPVAGWSYKVITAGTYGSQACTVGDMLVYDGSAWVLIPSGDDEKQGTVTSVATGQGLSGGTITTSGTIKHVDTTRSDTTSTATGSHGGTVTVVDGVTTNSMGHVTAVNVKTVTLPSETTLTKGTDSSGTATTLTHGGKFKAVTDTTVTGHQITDVVTEFTMPSETAIVTDQLTGTAKTLTHGGTVDVITAVAKGNSSHNVDVTKTTLTLPAETAVNVTATTGSALTPAHSGKVTVVTGVAKGSGSHDVKVTTQDITLPAETSLSKGTDATAASTLSHGGTFTAITETTVSGHKITDTTTTYTLPAETKLSKGTDATAAKSLSFGGTFTAVTDTAVDNHKITDTTTTFTMPSETTLSKGTDATAAVTLTHGGTFAAVTDTAVSGHKITDTTTTFTMPAETTLSVTDNESGNAVTDVTVSGHAITLKRGKTFLTAHPTISVGTDSTSTQTATHGGTFTAVDSVTRDANGHVTKINTKTVTLPSDANVTQTPTSSNASYPLLLAPSNQTTATTTTSYFDSGVTLNPATNTITSNITGSAKSLSPTEFYQTEGSSGYIKFATLSFSSWRQFNAVFLLQNQYSDEYSSSIVKICGSYNNTSIARFEFEIIGGDNVSNKLYYYKDGESYTFYVKKRNYSHWSFTLLSNVKNSIVFDGYSTLLTTATTTGTATYNVSAASASKLATERTIALSGGATGTATSFDGTKDVSIPVTSIKEAYLQWGGKNFAASWGPIDAAMVPNFAANRFAFLPASAITSEYSTDGGSTWTATTASAARENIFAAGGNFPIGNSTATGVDKKNYKCRITITTTGVVYTALNKFAIRISSDGSWGCHVKIESRTKADQDAGNDSWVTNCERAELQGWSGWNIINVSPITTHGNTILQYSQLRFTFGVDTHKSESTYPGLQVLRIMAFGGEGWTTCSNMAKDGHLYSYDTYQNATFPAGLNTVGQLKENGTRVSKVGHTHSVTAKGTTASTSITPAGSVSQPTFTGTEAGHTHEFTGTAASHDHTFTGTKHKHTFTGTAVTSGGASATASIYQITGVGTLPTHTYTAPSLTATVSNQCLTLTWSAGAHTFDAGTLPTRSSITVAKAHTHSVTAVGTLDEIAATGTVGSKSITPAGTIKETKITPAGTVSKPTFTGTAASHNHTFTGSAVTSGESSF